MPSGSNTRCAEEVLERLTGGPGDEHTEHVGADVVQPSLARLVQQWQRPEPAHPLIGLGRPLRLRWAVSQPERTHRLEQWLRPRCREVHAEPEQERHDVADRDRSVRRDGLAVDRPSWLDEHPPVGQFRQQLVDRLVEAQPALLDQEQRADGDDRLGHRGDPEDGVTVDRRRLAAGERAGKSDVEIVAARRQPGDPADVTALDVARHHVAQTLQPRGIESTHTGSDVQGARNSPPAMTTSLLHGKSR